MNPAILVKQCGLDNYQWALVGGDSQDVQTGDGEALRQSCSSEVGVIFIASTESVSLREVEFEAHEKKVLRQTIPYSLEDDLLEDVGELHFALGEVNENCVTVAWTKREQLEQWLDSMGECGLQVQQVLPELLLLPSRDNSWALIIDDDRWLLKSGKYQGFSLEASNASLALQLLLDEAEQLPESLLVYVGGCEQEAIVVRLPELLRDIIEWHEDDYWQVVCDACDDTMNSASSKQLNLLQGDYERKLPWRQWWLTWRVAAILLVSAVLLQFVAGFSQLQSLKSTNLSLRTEIEQHYREVIPRGPMVNPEKQLRRKVKALESGGGGGVILLLDKIAQVVVKTPGLSVQSLNYTEKQSEIRLTVVAAAFDDVETARANMEKLGLTAELTGSSSEKGKTRARLRIKS